MRYLVLSDIHSNLEALDTCLADARARGYDQTLVLGDIIGYGADPNAVVARIRSLNVAAVVRGNHDKIAMGLHEAEGFNMVATAAAEWTFHTLDADSRAWVAALPKGPASANDQVEICHGTPYDEDAYLFDEVDAIHSFEAMIRPLCLYGHTHCPVIFTLAEGVLRGGLVDSPPELQLPLMDGTRYLVNPGSVGQPRDGDPRAAYAIVDTAAQELIMVRIPYPVEVAQEKIVKAGLPRALADRLAKGR